MGLTLAAPSLKRGGAVQDPVRHKVDRDAKGRDGICGIKRRLDTIVDAFFVLFHDAAPIRQRWLYAKAKEGEFSGLDIETGSILNPVANGIFDNVCVKKAIVETSSVIAAQLLLVDEIMKAGRRGAGGNIQQ